MNWKEFLKPTKWKLILIALIAVFFLIIVLLQEISMRGSDDSRLAVRAVANATCAKYSQAECKETVTSELCQYLCTFDKTINRCKATSPGTPLSTAPAGTTC